MARSFQGLNPNSRVCDREDGRGAERREGNKEVE